MAYCKGSVSWNSSIRAMCQLAANACASAAACGLPLPKAVATSASRSSKLRWRLFCLWFCSCRRMWTKAWYCHCSTVLFSAAASSASAVPKSASGASVATSASLSCWFFLVLACRKSA